jgi:hypothetical protein
MVKEAWKRSVEQSRLTKSCSAKRRRWFLIKILTVLFCLELERRLSLNWPTCILLCIKIYLNILILRSYFSWLLLWALCLFMCNHVLSKSFSLHLFTSLRFRNIWTTFSSLLQRGHLFFSAPLLLESVFPI